MTLDLDNDDSTATGQVRTMHARLELATRHLQRAWGIDSVVTRGEVFALERELEDERDASESRLAAAKASSLARLRWSWALNQVLMKRIADSRVGGALKFAATVLAASRAAEKQNSALHQRRRELERVEQQARKALDSTEMLMGKNQELKKEMSSLAADRARFEREAEEQAGKVTRLEQRLHFAAGYENATQKRADRLDTDHAARLDADIKALKWRCEQSEATARGLGAELRRARREHHALGAAHAELTERREAEEERLRCAEEEIGRLSGELEVAQQISAERMRMVVEERRRCRLLVEETNGGGGGAGIDVDPGRTPARDAVSVDEYKSILASIAHDPGNVRESPRLPNINQKNQSKVATVPPPPAYVARALNNSRSMPPAMMPVRDYGASHQQFKFSERGFASRTSDNAVPARRSGILQHQQPSVPSSSMLPASKAKGRSLATLGGATWHAPPPAAGARTTSTATGNASRN